MKNLRYTLFVTLCVSLLSISVGALASQPDDISEQLAPATSAVDTAAHKVVEEPAMAAIPPAEKGPAKDAGQLDFSKVQEDPAMAAIPGK